MLPGKRNDIDRTRDRKRKRKVGQARPSKEFKGVQKGL